jgi:hypothetical protein
LLLADEMALYARPAFDAAAKGQPLALIDAWGGALSYSFQLFSISPLIPTWRSESRSYSESNCR